MEIAYRNRSGSEKPKMEKQTMRDRWLTKESLAELAKRDRLVQCLVRMGGCRFVAAAQDAQKIIDALESAGDYCRDVSVYQPMPPASVIVCNNGLNVK